MFVFSSSSLLLYFSSSISSGQFRVIRTRTLRVLRRHLRNRNKEIVGTRQTIQSGQVRLSAYAVFASRVFTPPKPLSPSCRLLFEEGGQKSGKARGRLSGTLNEPWTQPCTVFCAHGSSSFYVRHTVPWIVHGTR